MSTMTSELTLETLGRRVDELADDVARLKTQAKPKPLPKPRPTATPPEYEHIIARQIASGLIMEPSAEWLAWVDELNAEWEDVPADERAVVEEELRNLRLDPPLSEIIIKLRDGWYPVESEWVA